MSKREFLNKYSCSVLGKLWSILQPIIMLLIYSIVFIVILKSKWGLTESSEDFVLLLFLGLIIHKMIADVLTDGPLLIINNTNYVKKIIFPVEILNCPSNCIYASSIYIHNYLVMRLLLLTRLNQFEFILYFYNLCLLSPIFARGSLLLYPL